MDQKIRNELDTHPKNMNEIAQRLGDSWNTRTQLIEYYDKGEIVLEELNSVNLLILFLGTLILVEVIPPEIRGVPAFLVLMLFPWFWTNKLLDLISVKKYYTIPFTILELMMIGFISGYLGILTQSTIAIFTGLSMISKWVIIYYLNMSRSG